MPIYQYECESCHEQFDDIRKYDQRDEPAECPECNEPGQRVLAGFAVGGSSGSAASSLGPSCSTGGG